MALTEKQSKRLEKALKERLYDSYINGVQVGLLTASTVVLEKLDDNSKSLTNRVGDVKAFCKVATSQKKKFAGPKFNRIDKAETDDMQKVVHGKWVLDKDMSCHCSVCQFGRETDARGDWLFCPRCGTKMEYLVYG